MFQIISRISSTKGALLAFLPCTGGIIHYGAVQYNWQYSIQYEHRHMKPHDGGGGYPGMSHHPSTMMM